VNHARRPTPRIVLGLCLAFCSSLVTAPAAEQTVWDTVPSMDVVRSRLSLTPEQEAQLTPIFERRIGELQQLREQLAQATTQQQKRAVMQDAKKGQDAFSKQVEALLDASQKSEWRELRAQTREKVQERYEQQKDSQ
jgi:hypothetical protein